jgi:hypothetical protein
MQMDMRSNREKELLEVEARFLEIVKKRGRKKTLAGEAIRLPCRSN